VDQWSNGVNQADELNRIMKIRRAALNRWASTPFATARPWPRSKSRWCPSSCIIATRWNRRRPRCGGQDYIYAMRGDGRTPVKWEPAAESAEGAGGAGRHAEARRADGAQAGAGCDSAAAAGLRPHRELFPRTTGDGFDPLSPATVAADVTIGFVLQLDRAARMVAQHAVEPALPGLEEVIDRLTKATFDAPAASPYEAESRRAEERVLVDRVMWLATGAPNGQVRAMAAWKLAKLAARLKAKPQRARPNRRSARCWPPISSASWSGRRTRRR
jgi:hypothetical protein